MRHEAETHVWKEIDIPKSHVRTKKTNDRVNLIRFHMGLEDTELSELNKLINGEYTKVGGLDPKMPKEVKWPIRLNVKDAHIEAYEVEAVGDQLELIGWAVEYTEKDDAETGDGGARGAWYRVLSFEPIPDGADKPTKNVRSKEDGALWDWMLDYYRRAQEQGNEPGTNRDPCW